MEPTKDGPIDQKDGPSGWKFKDGRTRKLKAGTAVPDEAVRGHQEKLKELPESKKLKIKKLKMLTAKQITSENWAHKWDHLWQERLI